MKNWLTGMACAWALALGGLARGEEARQAVTVEDPKLLFGPTTLGDVDVAKAVPKVDVVILDNLPEGMEGTLWSSWGDGCVAGDGRYYTGIGNHLEWPNRGVGESRVYEYDPATRTLKLVINVRDVVADEKVAAGKIHAKIDQGRDGWLYFATYWGKKPGPEEHGKGFRGAALLRYDPKTGKAEDLGVPVPGQGIPTSVADGENMRMYAYAADSNDLVVWDLEKNALIFRGGGDVQEGSRAIMLDNDGNAYFSTKDGTLAKYDLKANEIRATKAKLPGFRASESKDEGGHFLRAAAPATKEGLIYGMTKAGRMFSFDPKTEAVEDLGDNVAGGEYTAAMDLSPDGRFIYYAPGAHGSATRIGTPVVQYDIAARRHKVIAFLNPVFRDKFNYNVGGSYNLKVGEDGAAVYCTFNGAPVEPSARREETFGQPCVVVVHIPEEER